MTALSTLTLGIFKDDPYASLDVTLTITTHPHPRARIRDAAVKRLREAALLPANIRPHRALATMLHDLPAVFVYTLSEGDPEEYSEGPLVLARALDLAVHVVVTQPPADGPSLEDALDAITRVVEIVLGNDRDQHGALSAQAAVCRIGTTTIKYEHEGERLLVHAGLTFRVTYQDEFGVPVGDALEKIHVDWDLAPPDEQIEAEDEITDL